MSDDNSPNDPPPANDSSNNSRKSNGCAGHGHADPRSNDTSGHMGNGPAGKRNGHATGGVGGDDDDDIHFEEDFGDPPQGAEFLDRARFILNRWLTLDLPPPDFLLGDLLHVTSRMLLVGATGIGK